MPGNWKLKHEDLKNEQWYWPIRLLKTLARLPIASDTWLGFGHTMDNEENFAKDTKLCAAILTGPQGTQDGSEVCILPSGEEVNFYQVIKRAVVLAYPPAENPGPPAHCQRYLAGLRPHHGQ